MKRRKTIEVSKLLKEANRLLEIVETDENAKYVNQDVKHGICNMIEYVLHETDNYRGFSYNEWVKRGGYEAWQKQPNDEKNDYTKQMKYMGKEYDRFYY